MNVADWLREIGLEQYVAAFRENAVTADVLPHLTLDDLKDLGVTAVGHRRRLLQAAAALRTDGTGDVELPSGRSTEDNRVPESGAERRQLSVVFCDLAGSTALSARLDPEDLREIIGAYHKTVAAVLSRYGGFVAKYMGDGVLAYFGYPHAHEDDAERVVRTGLALVDAVAGLDLGERLQLRIGVATGLVVVGDLLGSGSAQERAVVGETPNRAARLQALAGPNGVVIDAATRRQVGELFDCRDLGPFTLKGLPEPLQAWSVQSESAVESRFDALRATRLTPMIGRNEELDLLLHRWHQVAGGETRVVLVSGEPGIGKSRLLAALEERLRDEPCTRLRYFCSPHHQESPLYPIIAHLERAAGFTRDDTASDKLTKLQALFATGVWSKEDTSLLADMLSIPTEGLLPILNLSPQRRRERTFEALIRRLEALANETSVLMLVEDAHWADPSSIELFDLTIERLVGPPVLLVMTFRPEFHAPWIGRAGVSLLTLSRLDRRSIASMAANVATQAIPSELIERIATQTDGIPLFIEELTRSVVEAGIPASGAAARLAVPDSLQASLLARLDRLQGAKTVAQIGAVIGRSFSYELIAAVAGLPEPALREGLEELVASGLAFGRGAPPEASYIFKHSLVRDAAYESLLRGRRAALHGRVVEALLHQSPDIAEIQADLLGYHCAEAGLIEQAIDHWLKAGQLAIARSANSEAITQLHKALQSLDQLADDATRRFKEIDIRLALGGAFLVAKGQASPEARDAFSRVRELCWLTEEPWQLVPASWGLWLFYLNRAELTASVEHALELLQHASYKHDPVASLLGNRCVATSTLFQAKHAMACEHFDQTISLEELTSSDLIDQRLAHPRFTSGAAHSLSSWALLLQGHFDQALARRLAALVKSRASRDPHSLAVTLHQGCVFYQLLEDVGEVDKQSAELIALTSDQGFAHWHATGTIFRGWCVAVRGDREMGLAEMRKGLKAKQATGAELKVPYYLGLIAAFTDETAKEDAMGLFADALARVERTGERWFEAELHRLKGQVLLGGSAPSFADAEGEFQQALTVARQQGARFWELRAATSLARLWRDQRKYEDAQRLLAPVYAWFAEGANTSDMQKARALLTALA